MSDQELVVIHSGRLDKVLSLELQQSRNQIEKLIRDGMVEVDGSVIQKPSFRIESGEKIRYSFKEARKRSISDIDFDIDILYEDDDLMVVNKPSGLIVHSAPSVSEPTLVDWLIHKGISLSTISGEERHGIVHRIDKDTTGALVIAKNNAAHRKLSDQLQDKSMGRYYLALIDMPLKEHRMMVDRPIFRNPHNRLKMAIVEGGREAKTEFIRIAEGRDGISLIAAKLYTGRTHQIRVHLESLGRHILGDEMYGFKSKKGKIPRVFLHAYMLYLIHPTTGKKLEILAPLFDDMSEYIERNFDKGEIDEKLRQKSLESYFGTK